MTDYGLLYAATREPIATLVRDLGDGAASTPVPACPGWTVHDVVAHFAGSVTDALTGQLDGAGSDAWTGAQVEARRDVGMAEMLDEWTKGAAEFEDGLRLLGMPLAGLVISDAFQREQDVRAADEMRALDWSGDPEPYLPLLSGYGVPAEPLGER